jgi:ATP-dependent Lon protease
VVSAGLILTTGKENMKNDLDLSCIRTGTDDDLSDAVALASHLLDAKLANHDFAARRFSLDLMTAVLLTAAYGDRAKTLEEVLFYLSDPAWDSPLQILWSFANDKTAWQQPRAAKWHKSLVAKFANIDHATAAAQVQRCYIDWRIAIASADTLPDIAKPELLPASSIQVFDQQAVAQAVEMVGRLLNDKKAAAGCILENAQANDGYRDVPDACKASAKLEAAKARFENLVEPISRLQLDLILAAAMDPTEFRITPILLLGEPGIGKTFLATQLAEALGVATDKISAGGSQGGFQLTGSHSTWTGAQPGSIAALLAEDNSAAPVMVIDEVDKIGASAQYPVLPVLLDLLEPDTAKKFKDQFFDMAFDASRMIFILTANTLDGVPPALLSRVSVFHVPRPERAQRLRIIRETNADLCTKTNRQIVMDEGTCEVLASRTDLDIRKLVGLVREAFAKAVQFDQTLAELVLPAAPDPFELTGDVDESDVARKPAGPKWKYH